MRQRHPLFLERKIAVLRLADDEGRPLTQAAVAREAGVKPALVYQVFAGRRSSPRVLAVLARRLGAARFAELYPAAPAAPAVALGVAAPVQISRHA